MTFATTISVKPRLDYHGKSGLKNGGIGAIKIPNEVPIEDMTGKHCAKNQNEDKIWFLAGTYGGTVHRNCVIPNGRAIFFPVVNDLISFMNILTYKMSYDYMIMPALIGCNN